MPTLPFFQIRIILPAADEGSPVEPSCGTIHRELRVVCVLAAAGLEKGKKGLLALASERRAA